MLFRSLRSENTDVAVREEIANLVRGCGVSARVMKKARDYAQKAKDCIKDFPDGEAHHALAFIPDFIIERDR